MSSGATLVGAKFKVGDEVWTRNRLYEVKQPTIIVHVVPVHGGFYYDVQGIGWTQRGIHEEVIEYRHPGQLTACLVNANYEIMTEDIRFKKIMDAIEALTARVTDLELELKYSPGGSGYTEAQTNFEKERLKE